MHRSVPGLLRLTVLVGLVGFWVGAALLAAVLAGWSTTVVAVLGTAVAVDLVALLGLLGQLRARTHRERRPAGRAVPPSRAGRAA